MKNISTSIRSGAIWLRETLFAAVPFVRKIWAWIAWFFWCVWDGTFGIVRRPVEMMACATYMIGALLTGLWLGSAWATHTRVVIRAADSDTPSPAQCTKLAADMTALAQAWRERGLQAETELAMLRTARPMSEDKVVEASCEPKVIYKYVKAKKPKTFIENVFGN